jgi:hypothetical protein
MDEPNEELVLARAVWKSNSELSTLMPIIFTVNTVNRYKCNCVKCEDNIPDDKIRGNIRKLLDNVYEVNAVALCKKCDLFNVHNNIRIREDDGVVKKQFHVQGKGWAEITMDNKPKSLLEKLLNL